MNIVIASKLLITLDEYWYCVEVDQPYCLTLLTPFEDRSACWMNWAHGEIASSDEVALSVAKAALEKFCEDNGLITSTFSGGHTIKVEDDKKVTFRTTGVFDNHLSFLHISQWWADICIYLEIRAAGSAALINQVLKVVNVAKELEIVE